MGNYPASKPDAQNWIDNVNLILTRSFRVVFEQEALANIYTTAGGKRYAKAPPRDFCFFPGLRTGGRGVHRTGESQSTHKRCTW